MNNKKNKKGFTLIEMIIALAIIGILTAILIPSWNYFIRRARERDATAKAKVVFNAAQTEITRISVRERNLLSIANDSSADTVKRAEAQAQLYVGDGDFYFYWDGNHGFAVDAAGDAIDASGNAGNNASLARGINSITGSGGIYKVFVRGYNVESVVYSPMQSSMYKGSYPITVTKLEEDGADVDSIRRGDVQSMDMSTFRLSPT